MGATPGGALIAGVGNLLLGDEGVGVHVARALVARPEALRSGVVAIDAGTALLDFVGEISHYPELIIVDAVRAGGEPGTVYFASFSPDDDDERSAAPLLSLHEWSVFETLRVSRTLGLLPHRVRLIGAEPRDLEPRIELSPPLRRAAERIVALLLDEFGLLDCLERGNRRVGQRK